MVIADASLYLLSAVKFWSETGNFATDRDQWSEESPRESSVEFWYFSNHFKCSKGFRTVRQIAIAQPEELAKCKGLGPYPEHAARAIIRSARELLEKKAQELRETAEEMLKMEEEIVGQEINTNGLM